MTLAAVVAVALPFCCLAAWALKDDEDVFGCRFRDGGWS
jgi:hypothetical protein